MKYISIVLAALCLYLLVDKFLLDSRQPPLNENLSAEEILLKQETLRKQKENALKAQEIKLSLLNLGRTSVYCSATGVAYWLYDYGTPTSIAPALDSTDTGAPVLLKCDEAKKALAKKIEEQAEVKKSLESLAL